MQLKFSLSYILVIAAVLVLLNSYPLLVSQNLMVSSNQDNLKSTAKVIESALMGLGRLTEENVSAALNGLDETGATARNKDVDEAHEAEQLLDGRMSGRGKQAHRVGRQVARHKRVAQRLDHILMQQQRIDRAEKQLLPVDLHHIDDTLEMVKDALALLCSHAVAAHVAGAVGVYQAKSRCTTYHYASLLSASAARLKMESLSEISKTFSPST